MADAPPAVLQDHTGTACWRRIGSRGGDRTCDALALYERCEHCPVLRDAATAMLDRSPPEHGTPTPLTRTSSPPADAALRGQRPPQETEAERRARLFVFRLDSGSQAEWLALPATSIVRVEAPRPIHTLPHRDRTVVLGLVNVRGQLTVAASLPGLLGMPDTPRTAEAAAQTSAGTSRARLLVCTVLGETAAFPVDEAHGLLDYVPSALLPVPATLARAASHLRGLVATHERTVSLIDAERLFESLRRHLR